MATWFHDGELEIQQRAGTRQLADRVAESIDDRIPPAATPFLRSQPMLLLGAESAEGEVIATILAGAPGFLDPSDDESRLRIHRGLLPNDPLAESLTPGRPVGMQAIEHRLRRRMRLNGHVASSSGEVLEIALAEVYGNCPKYIQAREFVAADRSPGMARSGATLTAPQQTLVAESDTFYIASIHPERGADISHRGGMPGFVRVEDASRLSWPDYSGNNMFQTLGNLQVDDRAGLVFIAPDSGDILHVSGRCRVDWNMARAAQFPGAQRVIDFEIEHVFERPATFPMRGALVDYSQHNPPAASPSPTT
ncbi:MAG TPA: pyridoxamine 5'-phosphate oxidase family protein [Phycisphaerae bacterium]|nr:pyridoxamine 5'-phosphate oxidase family protein [Phycisphaerae bacterium]HRW53197.1 pyridoxamine 5'-phosphate oxidase family protein [Phycisphaerae bacterium]